MLLFMTKYFLKSIFLTLIPVWLMLSDLAAQPVVVGHPQDSSICVGASASFRVLALNTAAYQWQENDGVGWYNINASITYAEGYLTPELRIIDANLGLNAYQYRCVVFDAQNNQTISDPAILGVFDPPIITQQPLEQRVCKNSIAQFSVQALYGTAYQWQESIGAGWVNLTDNAFYTGSQTPELSIFTTTGMSGFSYRCVVTNVSCPETSNTAKLFVDPTPVIFSLTGGGEYCEGGTGVAVGLSDSEIGISYHLLRNEQSTGVVRNGTCETIVFGTFALAGDYTVRAINGFTGCEINMDGLATVSINPLPAQQILMGGGSYCIGSAAPELYLQNTQTGVDYNLIRNGVFTGNTLTGNGFSMSFGNVGQSGTYSVAAKNTSTGCSVQLTSTRIITANSLPEAIAGNDQLIIAGNSTQLSGTALNGSGNYMYFWAPESFCQNPNLQTTITIPLYQTSLFTLRVRDNQTGCYSQPDSVSVQVADGPLSVYIQVGDDIICPQETVSLLALTSGGTGNYLYQWSSIPPGLNETSSMVVVSPNISTTYVVRVQDGLETVYDTIGIIVNNLPVQQHLSEGAAICSGSAGVGITLGSSEQNAIYFLYRDTHFVKQLNGNGNQLNFGSFNVPGTYRVTARYTGNGCEVAMIGEAVISLNPIPVAIAGPNQFINSGSQTSLSGEGGGGSGNYLFQWSPTQFLLNPNNQNAATISLTATTVFNLQVTDQQTGCQSDPDQTVVFVIGDELSLALAASDYSVCPGEQVSLIAMPTGGSGNFTYLWQSNPPGFFSTQFNPVATIQQTTTYRVSVTDGFTVITDSVVIEVRPAATSFIVNGGGSFCEGGQGREVFLNDSEQNILYQLIRNGSETGVQLYGSGNQLNFGFQHIAGTYTVTATNLSGNCTTTMSGTAVVQVNQSPLVNAGNDRTIGKGQSANLNGTVTGGSGVYAYSWLPVEQVLNPMAQNTATKPQFMSTLISFGVTDLQSGCKAQLDTVIVYVSGGSLEVNAFANSQQGCQGGFFQLYGLASGGTGNYQYQWTSIPPGFYSNTQNPQVQPQYSTSYILTVYDGLDNFSDTLLVNVSQPPQQYLLTGGGSLCQIGQTVSIGLNGSQPGLMYFLVLNGQEVSMISGTGSAISFGLFGQPGAYSAYAQQPMSLCSSEMIGEAVISIDAAPIAFAGPDKYINAGGQITLDGAITGGSGQYIFQWTPESKLLNPDALQPTTKPLYNTMVFRLDVSDSQSGCSGSTDYAAVFVQGGNFQLQVLAAGGGGCPGTDIQLFALPTGGSGSFSYAWLSNPPGFSSTTYNPVFNPVESTTFIVLVNDGNQIFRDSVFVFVEQGPVDFLLSVGGDFCKDEEEVVLSLSGSQPDVFYHLLREGTYTGLSLNGTGFPISFNPISQSGTYTVRAESQLSGCQKNMQGEALVQIHEKPRAFAGPDRFIQSGESTTLSGSASGGSGDYQYSWNPAHLLMDAASDNPQTIALTGTSLFLLQVTDEITGCLSHTDTTNVYVTGGNLRLTLLASSASVCKGSPVYLQALPSGGNGNYQVYWNDQEGNALYEGESWTDYPLQTTTYVATLNSNGETITDSLIVVVSELPLLFEVTGGGVYCPAASPGVLVGLSGSENGLVYDLYLNQVQKIGSVNGQGIPINFGYFSQEGSYTVSARVSGFGCELLMNGNAVVERFEAPIANAGNDIVINKGEVAQLSVGVTAGSGNYAFAWSPSEYVESPGNAQTSTLPLNVSVLFTVEVTDLNTSCISSDAVVVFTQGGPLESSVQTDAEIVCPGESTRITALPSGGSGSYSWTWSSNPPGYFATSASIKVFSAVSTWYIVQISDDVETIRDSVLIEAYNPPLGFELTGGGVFCEGNPSPGVGMADTEPGVTYELMRNGSFTGQWITGTGSGMSFGTQHITGSYTVVATSNQGCKALMPNVIVIGMNTLPQMFTLIGGGEFCDNDLTARLYLTGSEKQTFYELLRNLQPTGISISGDGSPIVFPAQSNSGIYTVEANRAGPACPASMMGTASLLIFPLPQPEINGPVFMCRGEEITLYASGADSYEWLTEPAMYSAEIVVSPDQATEYAVIAYNTFGCNAQASHLVDVGELPELSVDNIDETRTIVVSPSGLAHYTFAIADEIIQSGVSNTFVYGNLPMNGDTITVTASTVEGCSAEAKIFVSKPVSAANAFTPNGDGINDRFMTDDFIRIYSRWGKELFAGDEGWDGKFNGSLVAPGTYYYVFEMKDPNGQLIKTIKGSVTLVIE